MNWKFVGKSLVIYLSAVVLFGLMSMLFNHWIGLDDWALSWIMSLMVCTVAVPIGLMQHAQMQKYQKEHDDMIANPEDRRSYWVTYNGTGIWVIGRYDKVTNTFAIISFDFILYKIPYEDVTILRKVR